MPVPESDNEDQPPIRTPEAQPAPTQELNSEPDIPESSVDEPTAISITTEPTMTPANTISDSEIDQPSSMPDATLGSAASPGLDAEANEATTDGPEGAITSEDSGLSGGAKAGLAIGILAIIGLLAGAIIWLYKRKQKKNARYDQTDDEKAGEDFVAPAGAFVPKDSDRESIPENGGNEKSHAPHLSLRPVTQFLPEFGGAKNRPVQDSSSGTPNTSTASAGSMSQASHGASRGLTHGKGAESVGSDKTATNPFTDPASPSGDWTKPPSPPNVTVTPPPSSDQSGMEASTGSSSGQMVGSGAAVGATGSSGQGASPATSNQPESRSTALAAANAAGARPPLLHRVQLAFKPSMDDELELRTGQLIKIVHEYDDGWV